MVVGGCLVVVGGGWWLFGGGWWWLVVVWWWLVVVGGGVVEESEEQNVAKPGEIVHGGLSHLLQSLSAIEESQHEILQKLDLVHAAGAHS